MKKMIPDRLPRRNTTSDGNNDPSKAFRMTTTGVDSKSMTCKSLRERLLGHGSVGEFLVEIQEGASAVDILPLHPVYVHWCVDEVLPTLKKSDAKKSSLAKWHWIQTWERQLTSAVEITPHRMILDISDDFCIDSWLDGFGSFNLTTLAEMPGIDVDRRMLRMAFFAELAIAASSEHLYKEPAIGENTEFEATPQLFAPAATPAPTPPRSAASQQETRLAPSEALTLTPHIRALKEGTRVTVVDVQEGDGMLCNGMEGRVVCLVDPGKYMVSFSNLINAQEVDASNLRRAEKVRRNHHLCMFGELAVSICSRCRLKWYSSRDCQVADYQRHKCICKQLASDDPMESLTKAARKAPLKDDSPARTVDEE